MSTIKPIILIHGNNRYFAIGSEKTQGTVYGLWRRLYPYRSHEIQRCMLMWAIALGDLCRGFLLAVVFGCWTEIRTWLTGAKAGAIIGLLMWAGVDLIMYGKSNLTSISTLVVDVIIVVVMTGVSGAVVALILRAGSNTQEEK